MLNPRDVILNFLDIETTGGNYKADKIIEIYVSKIKDNQVLDTYHSMVNPGFRPDPFITQLTGISYNDLKTAPPFEDIADELYDFLNDGIVVAHNARFDYSFIKNHLKDFGLDVDWDYCCTVKLSRFLYPQYKSHRLDYVIARIGFEGGDRHRASYDTEAIKFFFYKAMEEHGEEKFSKAFNSSIKQSAIPEALLKIDMKEIPETPGVYIFYGEDDYPLYVGMSKNLRRRIYEHFYQDLTNSKDSRINQKLKRIETIPTAGVLGASIRESLLVKKYQPLFNRQLRRNSGLVKLEYFYDANGYINTQVNNDNNFQVDQLGSLVGVFRSRMDLKNRLEGFVKDFGLCPRLLGLEKGKGACFSSQLQHCKGACVQRISAEEYNKIFNKAFENIKIANWPGDSEIVITEERDGLKENLTFNKWCLVKSSMQDIAIDELQKFRFDLDTYKILHRHLRSLGKFNFSAN